MLKCTFPGTPACQGLPSSGAAADLQVNAPPARKQHRGGKSGPGNLAAHRQRAAKKLVPTPEQKIKKWGNKGVTDCPTLQGWKILSLTASARVAK
eukprot:1159073-Pelagomonas_calceolata.AAC.1